MGHVFVIDGCEPLGKVILRQDGIGTDSYAALDALISIGSPAVDTLVAVLGSRDPLVREAAARALGDLGDPRAAPHLTLAMSDAHKGVRERAADALRRLRQ